MTKKRFYSIGKYSKKALKGGAGPIRTDPKGSNSPFQASVAQPTENQPEVDPTLENTNAPPFRAVNEVSAENSTQEESVNTPQPVEEINNNPTPQPTEGGNNAPPEYPNTCFIFL